MVFTTFSLRLFQAVLLVACITMAYLGYITYQQYPIHKQFRELIKLPWMATTLVDYYLNLGLIFLWVCLKESTILSKLMWLIVLFFTGSIGSTFYVFLQTLKLTPGDSISKLLLP